MLLTKSDYLKYRECARNVWMKIHRKEIYKQHVSTSVFTQMLFDGGNEVDVLARDLFPRGISIASRGEDGARITAEHIEQKTQTLFQPVFIKDNFYAALDILEYNPITGKYIVTEVKSGTHVKEEYLYDLAFQVNLLRMCGLSVEKVQVMHLNKTYKRNGLLNKIGLFHIEDVTEKVERLCNVVLSEMQDALNFLSQEELPLGNCACIYKGRSKHCITFALHNPNIPPYSIHDISRIGQSQKKIVDLIDSGIYTFSDIPPLYPLSVKQQNQITAYNSDIIIADKTAIANELDKLEFPLYFIDYETLAAAIPRYEGYTPYQHIPFQYSLYVLDTPTSEPRLLEFLHTEKTDPCHALVESLKKHIGDTGSIIVWYEPFESTRNEEVAKHLPEMNDFMVSLNNRIYDLRDIFDNQLYVHKDFLGKTSIKNVLPVMVPELSYKDFAVQDGGMASTAWNKLMTEELSEEDKQKIIQDLKIYCGLDAYAMYAIWQELHKVLFNIFNV